MANEAVLRRLAGWIKGIWAVLWPVMALVPFCYWLVVAFWVVAFLRGIVGVTDNKNPFWRLAWAVSLIGFLANGSVVCANSGKMPVVPSHSIKSVDVNDKRHALATPNTHLLWLADIHWSGFSIFSKGDGVIVLAALVAMPGIIVRNKYRKGSKP